MCFLEPIDFFVQIDDLLRPLIANRCQELDRLFIEEWLHRFELNLCQLHFRVSSLEAISQLHDGSQQLVLLTDANEHAMCFAQFVKMVEQSTDPLVPRFSLQHMLPNKIVETLDIFHGYGLIEDIHRFGFEARFALDPTEVLFVT